MKPLLKLKPKPNYDINWKPTETQSLDLRMIKKLKEHMSHPDTKHVLSKKGNYEIYLEKKALLLSGLLGAAGYLGGKKLLNAGSSYLMRRAPVISNVFAPHYKAMSQLGYRAGINPDQNILPTVRKAIGMIAPNQSGVLDYEFAKEIGRQAKAKALEQGYEIPQQLPSFSSATSALNTKANTPILNNFVNSDTPMANRLAGIYSKYLGQGADKPGIAQTVAATGLSAALAPEHTLMGHGLETAADLYHTGLSGLYNADRYSTISNLKHKLINFAKQPYMTNANKLISPVINTFDPSMGEFYDLGNELRFKQQQTNIHPLEQFGYNGLSEFNDHEAKPSLLESFKKDIVS